MYNNFYIIPHANKIAIISICLAFLLGISTGCSNISVLNEGIVVDKQHHNSAVITSITPVSTGKTTIMVPMTTIIPERWEIIVEGYNNKNEKIVEIWSVSHSEWEIVKIGDKVIRKHN